MKIWPISVKRWKPVWIRACTSILNFLDGAFRDELDFNAWAFNLVRKPFPQPAIFFLINRSLVDFVFFSSKYLLLFRTQYKEKKIRIFTHCKCYHGFSFHELCHLGELLGSVHSYTESSFSSVAKLLKIVTGKPSKHSCMRFAELFLLCLGWEVIGMSRLICAQEKYSWWGITLNAFYIVS